MKNEHLPAHGNQTQHNQTRTETDHTAWQTAEQAIEWIHSLLTLGIKPGLKRMEWMLAKLNNPERRLRCVHIGGTNGKGSTLAFMRHVLEDAGFEVGTFTSPYIERFHNRIQINGQDISDEDLLHIAKQIKPLADELARTELGAPTEFEVVTMIAIYYFAKVAFPDIVLMEVGLGGRYDSTNVIFPILSIITNIGHDHLHILGETLPEIAKEKAGIIKSGVHTVTAVDHEEALAVIREKAQAERANLYCLNDSFSCQAQGQEGDKQTFTFTSMYATYESLAIQLRGKHQLINASVAIMALEVIKQFYAVIWEEEHLRTGLAKTAWQGRLEVISREPLTIVDGAHNLEGMKALATYIQEEFAGKKVQLIFAAMQDKQIAEMLEQVDGIIDQLILTQFAFPRVASVEQIQERMQSKKTAWQSATIVEADWQQAYQQTANNATEDTVILFAGSLYFIAGVRQYLKK